MYWIRRSLEGIPTVFHFSQKGARIRISWNLLGKDPPTLKSECGEPSFLDIVVNNHCARHVYKVLSLEKRQSRDPVGGRLVPLLAIHSGVPDILSTGPQEIC